MENNERKTPIDFDAQRSRSYWHVQSILSCKTVAQIGFNLQKSYFIHRWRRKKGIFVFWVIGQGRGNIIDPGGALLDPSFLVLITNSMSWHWSCWCKVGCSIVRVPAQNYLLAFLNHICNFDVYAFFTPTKKEIVLPSVIILVNLIF